MGRDMLAQDYILKQLTSSMMYPEDELGGEFWQRVYKKAQEKFGTSEIPTNTFNKIWIVPEEAIIYVNGTNIFVSNSRLKVMLEEDYLALEHHDIGLDVKSEDANLTQETKAILKEILIPEIEREVNEGKNFAPLRQMYHSMILATWYKNNLRDSLLGKVYIDENKVKGVDVEDKDIKNKIYNQYIEAFKKGVYDYIREDYDAATQKVIPRKYFSGGLGLEEVNAASSVIAAPQPGHDIMSRIDGRKVRVSVDNELTMASSSASSDEVVLSDAEVISNLDEIIAQSNNGRSLIFSNENRKKYNLVTRHAQLLVDENGEGFVVLGRMGDGKSKLSMDLLEKYEDYKFVADDRVLVAVVNGRIFAGPAVFSNFPKIAYRPEGMPANNFNKESYVVRQEQFRNGFVRVRNILNISLTKNESIDMENDGSGLELKSFLKSLTDASRFISLKSLGEILSNELGVWILRLPENKEKRFKGVLNLIRKKITATRIEREESDLNLTFASSSSLTMDTSQLNRLEKETKVEEILRWMMRSDSMPKKDVNLVWLMGTQYSDAVLYAKKIYDQIKERSDEDVRVLVTGGVGNGTVSLNKLKEDFGLPDSVETRLHELLDGWFEMINTGDSETVWQEIEEKFNIHLNRDRELMELQDQGKSIQGELLWKKFIVSHFGESKETSQLNNEGQKSSEEYLLEKLLNPLTRENALIPEGIAYWAYLVDGGIEEDRILIDAQSTTSLDNIYRGTHILTKEGFNPKNIAVVQYPIYQVRATPIVRKQLPIRYPSWNSNKYTAFAATPDMTDSYMERIRSMGDEILEEMIGFLVNSFDKLEEYGNNGSFDPVEVPEKIRQFLDELQKELPDNYGEANHNPPDSLTVSKNSPILKKIRDTAVLLAKAGMAFIFGTGNNGTAVDKNGDVYTANDSLLEIGHNILFKAKFQKWIFTGKQMRGDKPSIENGLKEAGDMSFEELFSGPNLARRFSKLSGALTIANQFIDLSDLPKGVNGVQGLFELLQKKSLNKIEKKAQDKSILLVLMAISKAVVDNNDVAIKFVTENGLEMGKALAPMFNEYINEEWVENFVLVSGVGENLAKVEGRNSDEDFLVGPIRQGLRSALKEAGVLESRIDVITKGVVRSEISWEREISAARLTTQEIEKLAALGEDVEHISSIGISLGGTKIGVGLLSKGGEISEELPPILWSQNPRYNDGTAEGIVRGIVDQFEGALEKSNESVTHIKKIGVAFAGPVDRESGIVGTPFPAPNLPSFDNYDLKNALLTELQFRGYGDELSPNLIIDIYNDGAAAVLGEVSPQGKLVKIQEDSIDGAQVSSSSLGGIDFNANNLKLKEQGRVSDINFKNFPNIQSHSVTGVVPVIINIAPITNFPFLIGLTDTIKPQEITSLN